MVGVVGLSQEGKALSRLRSSYACEVIGRNRRLGCHLNRMPIRDTAIWTRAISLGGVRLEAQAIPERPFCRSSAFMTGEICTSASSPEKWLGEWRDGRGSGMSKRRRPCAFHRSCDITALRLPPLGRLLHDLRQRSISDTFVACSTGIEIFAITRTFPPRQVQGPRRLLAASMKMSIGRCIASRRGSRGCPIFVPHGCYSVPADGDTLGLLGIGCGLSTYRSPSFLVVKGTSATT